MQTGIKHFFESIKPGKLFPALCICAFLCNTFAAVNAFGADPAQKEKYCPVDGVENKVEEITCEPPKACDEPGCIDSAPADGITRVSGTVGHRPQSYDENGKPVGSTGHKGTDYAAAKGSPIYAAADGVVIRVKYNYSVNAQGVEIGYGNYVVIQHANGVHTVYAHMNCWAEGLSVGDKVKKGQVIGFVGNTGGSTGPHLHVEYRQGSQQGAVIDPLLDDAKDFGLCSPPEEFANAGGGGSNGGGNGGSGGGSSGGGGNGGSAGGSQATPPNDHSDKDCNPQIFRKKLETCLFCNLFKVAFNTSSEIAKKAYETFAKPVANVVAVIFALWIAFNLIKFLSGFQVQEPKRFLKELINKAFVVIFVFVLLYSDSATFMGLALEPIFNTGFKLAMMAMDGDFTSCSNDYGITAGGGLPASMGNNIVCTVKIIQDKLTDVLSIGTASFCVSWYVKNFYIFPHLGYLISGGLIWLAALLLLFIFPFLMLDAVLHLAVACALLPAAIGAYAFNATEKYVKKIWETFLHAMFQFVFLTIVLMILFKAIEVTMGNVVDGSVKAEFINAGRWEKLLKELSWTGISFLELVFILLLGWAVLGQIAEFAKSFAGSLASGGIGSKIGGMAASAAVKGFKRTVAPALNIVRKDAGHAIASATAPVRAAVSRGAKNVQNKAFANKAFQKFRGIEETTDANGNTTYSYKSWLLRRDKTRTLENVNGETVITTTKNTGAPKWARSIANAVGETTTGIQNKVNKGLNTAGNFVRGTFDMEQKEFTPKEFVRKTESRQRITRDMGNMKVEIVKDTRGNEVSRNVQFTDRSLQRLESRGHIDIAKIRELRNSDPQSADLINEAVMNQVMEQRMPGSISRNATLQNVTDQGHIEVSTDSHGNEIMQRTQIEDNGTQHIYKMITDAEGKVSTVYEKIHANGQVERLESNGMVNKKTTYKVDKDGNEVWKSRKTSYAFAQHLTQNRSELPVDYYGHTAKYMPSKEDLGVSDEEWREIVKQYQNERKNRILNEFAD